jgi:membrane protein YdbS with pleckstrin-like domain
MPENPPAPPGEVKPHRNLRSLYLTYLLIAIWAGFLPWLIPLTIFVPPVFTLAITVPVLLLALFFVWWTGAYYHTILYRFSTTGISWERGVWWRQTGTVPYDRITSVDIFQGPLSRLLGISVLKVQTAGSPAQTASATELKIEGMTDAEALRDYIVDQMQSHTTV